MATQTIKIDVAMGPLKTLKTIIKDLRDAIRALDKSISKMNSKLTRTVNRINQLASNIQKTIKVKVNTTPSVPGQGQSSGSQSGPTKPPTMPEYVLNFLSNLRSKAGQYAKNVIKNAILNNPKASAALLRFLPALAPLALALGAVTAGIMLLKASINALKDVIEARLTLTTATQGNASFAGRAKELGAALGLDPNKIASDAQAMNLNPDVFWTRLKHYYGMRDKPMQAEAFRQAAGIGEEYRTVLGLPPDVFAETYNSKRPMGKVETETFARLNYEIQSTIADLKEFGQTLMALMAGLSPIVLLLTGLHMIYKMLRNKFAEQDAVASKLDKAATKLNLSADKMLAASGYYGGGDKFRRSMDGVFINPMGNHTGATLKKRLRELGQL